MKAFFSAIGRSWKQFGIFLGEIVGRIVLVLFYGTVILPWGVAVALLSDPLDIKKKDVAWHKRATRDLTLEDSYGQF
jgi:hypothetical protein